MKKISFFLSILLLSSFLCVFPVSAVAAEKGYPPATKVDITAQSVLLKNLETNDIVYEKNADAGMNPAYLTTVMTAVIAIEHTENLETEQVKYPISVQNFLYEYQQTAGAIPLAQLLAGEEMSMAQFLQAMLLRNAVEASMTIAQHVARSQEDFVTLMNQKAEELGMESTHFTNASGLYDKEQVTTARDMAILTEYAMSLPAFEELVNTVYYNVDGTNKHDSLSWVTNNDMLREEKAVYSSHVSGVKATTLPEGKSSLITTASDDGFRYLLILLDCKQDDSLESPMGRAFLEAQSIYNWVFSSFRTKTLIDSGTVVGEIPVNLSLSQDFVQVATNSHFSALIPDDIDFVGEHSELQKVLLVPESLDAPVQKGEKVGELQILLSGQELGRVDLVANSTIEASGILKILQVLRNTGRTFWFKFVVVFVVLLVLSYIVLVIVRNRNKRRRGYGKPPKNRRF